MLRVSGNNVLVVPPFECAWLSSDEHQLRDGRGCICFQVKGRRGIIRHLSNYATANNTHLQVKMTSPSLSKASSAPSAGSTCSAHKAVSIMRHPKWTPTTPSSSEAMATAASRLNAMASSAAWYGTQPHHTFHTHTQVHDVIGARVPGDVFTNYWLDYNNGAITIGAGTPSTPAGMHRWVDPHPLEGLRFIGLSSWDKHVAYRNITVGPCLADARRWGAHAPADCAAQDHVVPLRTCAAATLVAHLAPDNVVPLLVVADLPLVDALRLREAALAFLAANAESVLRAVPHHLPRLSVVHVEDMLCHAELVCARLLWLSLPQPITDVQRGGGV